MTTVALLSPGSTFAGTSAATELVTTTFTNMNAALAGYTSSFDGVLSGLLNSSFVGAPAPTFNITAGAGELLPAITQINTGTLANISATLPSAPSTSTTLTAAPTMNLPSAPVMESIVVPSPPTLDLASAPSRPAVDTTFTLPSAPTLNLPVLDTLTTINVPTFVAPVLPTFNESAPLMDAVAPNVLIAWTEPAYTSESMTAVLATLARFRLGGTGLPAAIEQQLFDRARAREDMNASKAVGEAYDAFAARGFVAPPGVLLATVSAAREANQLASNSLQREIMTKVADIELENMRFSVTQGLAAEQILVNIFINAVQRQFEIAKFTVESMLALYNTKVNIFNASVQAFQIKAQVYKTVLDGALAALESYRMQMEGVKVASEINHQRVETYTAQVQAVLAQIEVYKAQITGVQAKADLAKTVVEAYKADVAAFAESVGAQKVKFDAYRSQVEAEAAKGAINSSKASVFSSLVGAEATRISAWKDQAQVEIARLAQVTSNYSAQIEGYRANTAAQLGQVQAQAEVARTSIAGVQAQNVAIQAANEARIRIGEQQLQSSIAAAGVSTKLYEANITQISAEQDLKARSLQAAGQMLSTLAGGAMAAMHVQATVASSTSEGMSFSKAEQITNSLSDSA